MIGRSLNTGNNDLHTKLPSFNIEDLKGDRGCYVDADNKVCINSDRLKELDGLGGTLAHELGHWFEHILGDTEIENRNALALLAQFGKKAPKQSQPTKKYTLDAKINPIITARDDGYGNTIYQNYGLNSKGKYYNSSEVFTIAVQYFFNDPELFIRRCPWQFNLMMESFMELQK